MIEMKLDVNLNRCWIGHMREKYPVDVTLLDTNPIPTDDHGVQDLVDVELNGADPSELEDHVRTLPGVDFVSISHNEGTKVKMIVGTRSCLGCQTLARAEAFLLSAKVLDDGWVEWRVVHEKRSFLDGLVEKLNGSGMETRSIEISEYSDKTTLTRNENRVLRAALEMGYYNFPKSVGVRELAKKLSVSTAFISYTLRSAQKRTIELYFNR